MTRQPEDDAASDAKLKTWLQAELGGTILRFDRVKRWRPAWLVDVALDDGTLLELYVRGDRPIGFETERLEQEFGVLKLLAEHAVPVPKIYGWCDDPRAIIMARVDGAPFVGGGDTDPKIRAAVKEYITHLAAIHSIPVERGEELGLFHPRTPEEIAFTDFRRGEKVYLANKSGPDALSEFVRLWLKRNAPLHRTKCCLLVADGPQFMHKDGKVQALIDLELAQIGDPMLDLAGLRRRDPMEPSGGMKELIELYAEVSGNPIDPVALSFYTVSVHIYTVMYARPQFWVGGKHPGYVEYMSWCMSSTCFAMQAIAEADGVVLQEAAPVEPTATPNRYALEALVGECEAQDGDTGFYYEAPALSIAHYLQRLDQFGKTIEAMELAEAEQLLGERCDDLAQAEENLEVLVLHCGPERDVELAQFFYTRETRRIQLIADYPSPIVRRRLELVLPYAGKVSIV